MHQLTSFIKTIKENIRKVSSANIYLYGSNLRDICIGKPIKKVKLVVTEKDKDTQKKILSSIKNILVDIRFLNKVDYSNEYYTVDNLYAEIPENFNGDIELQSTNHGLRDFNKRILKLTKSGEHNIIDLDSIFKMVELVSDYSFNIEANSVFYIFNNRHQFQHIEKRKFFMFLKKLVGLKKPRKSVSILNTLGIPLHVLGVNLHETPILNNLSKNDIYEFMYVILYNIEDFSILKEKGFSSTDIEMLTYIKNTIESISITDINNKEEMKNIFLSIRKKRFSNILRLLRRLGFNEHAKLLQGLRKIPHSLTEMCINSTDIKDVFGTDNKEFIQKMLECAFIKISQNPDYNEKYKILSYLNDERYKGTF